MKFPKYKVKLNFMNLDALHLLQDMVYINIVTPKEDLENHDLICDSYISLRHVFLNWKIIRREGMLREYLIESDKVKYSIVIDLNKDFHNCSQVSLHTENRVFNQCSINVFNIEFVK